MRGRLRVHRAPVDVPDPASSEPFGFADGISQPNVDWERERPLGDHDRLDYDNLVCLGEFLLGYPNEYGLYTPRPLLAPQRDPGRLLPRAEDAPEEVDLGRNGAISCCVNCSRTCRDSGASSTGRRAAMRICASGWPQPWWAGQKNGEPLAASGDTAPMNDFTYEADPQGLRCPLGAHIRRANPRNADLPPGGRGLFSRLSRMLGFNAAALEPDLDRVDTFSSPASPRTKVRGCRGRRALPDRRGRRHPLHLPCGQHQAPVRVRAKRVAGREQVRRPHRRKRSDRRPPLARRREFFRPTASRFRRPAVRTAV